MWIPVYAAPYASAGFRILPSLFPAMILPATVAGLWVHQFPAAVFGAFVVALIIGFRRYRDRMVRLVRQRNELTLAVTLRTRELHREKAIIERQKEEIELLLEKTRQSNRLKDEFLANISHEIRTPLHGFLAMTALVLTTDLRADQREYLGLAESSAHSLLGLLNNVLDFSKIDAGHLTLESLPFSIRECVHTALCAFPVAAAQKGIAFSCNIAPEVPETIEGDPVRVRQILTNLIANAVKFTDRGSVRLEVSAEPGVCIEFRVQDTGIGVPEEKRSAIFEPFRQADGSTTRKYGGTGLGLSISSRLALQMGGELTLESKEGHGSTFILRLPYLDSLQHSAFTDESHAAALAEVV